MARIPARGHRARFGARFSPGNWNAGIVRLDNTLILLTTLKKGGLTAGSHDEDHVLGPDRMQWQSPA